ncbi:glycosyltransferase family 4 protein [Alkalicoccus urumqiensis]|uniref:Glycosyl transferase n=1 Tax=Alkalicoccus urumqiensis TaxID=1548213 RepID=A0A2P6MJX3_ALKUR|nr:glycosyltransferase family 1 protein [Alkalicoccus urumqiensis]PRO66561.1 glycosyl transferase [Alkalicoccus urumqiensis]
MKIAIITETFLPSTDGIVTRLTASIRWLKREGHDILIIAPDLGVTEFEGCRVAGIPAFTFFLYKDKQYSLFSKKVGRELDAFAPDVVHVVNPAFLGVTGIFAARRRKLPLIASYHTHFPKYADYYRVSIFKPALWWYARTLHNRAHLNLCTSQTVLDELKERRFHNIHLWKRGVDTEMYTPERYEESMRERLTGGQPEKKLLLFVGRLAPEKEIETVRELLDSSDDFCLAVVGDGPHRSVLEETFAGTNTVFTGFLHGEELASAYASSDVFVFPSTTETLGLVLMEAMASGLPVIAADSGPTREQVRDGETGVLYDADTPGDFTRVVTKLQDEDYRRRLGQLAAEESRSIGWDAPSAQLLSFYEEVASPS